LVGHRITLADIVVSMTLYHLYELVFDPGFRKPFVNTNRWYTTLVNQPEFHAILGEVKLATKMEVASGGKAPTEPKEDKKKEEKKDKKEDKKKEREDKKKEKDDKKKKKEEKTEELEDKPAHAEEPEHDLEEEEGEKKNQKRKIHLISSRQASLILMNGNVPILMKILLQKQFRGFGNILTRMDTQSGWLIINLTRKTKFSLRLAIWLLDGTNDWINLGSMPLVLF